MPQESVRLEGHIVDSDVLRRVLARIVEGDGEFEFQEFEIGKTNEQTSTARLLVRAPTPQALDAILEGLSYLGAAAALGDAAWSPAERDGILPDEFYSTTNFPTWVRVKGNWLEAAEQKMDCALVLRDGRPVCVKQRLVRAGDPVALRGVGLRVRPSERPRASSGFGFMQNEVSAEVNKGLAIAATARAMREARENSQKIALVAGPAIVHSGGDAALGRLVRAGWVDVVLSGNAFAAHDLEKAILRTSLGVCQLSGRALEGGSRNHLFAINAVNRAGGIRGAVESKLVQSGVMHELVRAGVPFVLAGSIRDDGPLVDVISDTLKAQEAYAEALRGVGVCLMLASALHAIAVGNLLPASVRTVCVDMSESVPTKLGNRGTMQAIGLVTDVGFFLEQLAFRLVPAWPTGGSQRA
jgi:lysine-ketoglutarate reductase/saccharopine dehydrogenase-like protein (TIGR00300 family)